MRLGTLLLRNASIGLSQLESALRHQVLYGGRLGTNLVELGFVEVDLLSRYLADLTGVPSATSQMLDLAPAEALAKLGADLAHQLGAIPLGGVPDPTPGNASGNAPGSGGIPVALINPHDRNALAILRTRLGGAISPYVMPELRAFYYLERHFGQPRQARFVRSGGRTSLALTGARGGAASAAGADGLVGPDAAGNAASSDRRRIQPPAGLVLPPPLTVPPRRRRASSISAPPSGVPSVSFAAACERLAAATHRDQLADTIISYAEGRLSALLIFLVRDANALWWRGTLAASSTSAASAASTGSAATPPRFEEISIPLGGASAFQAAHDTLAVYSGPPPSPGHPVESQLWEALGEKPDPATVTVVPVILKRRVVNLIYAHTAGGVPADVVDELSVMAQHAQDAYLRLIRQSKG